MKAEIDELVGSALVATGRANELYGQASDNEILLMWGRAQQLHGGDRQVMGGCRVATASVALWLGKLLAAVGNDFN
jgi:uncharacterized protein YjbJ (UPF0337 family)